MTRLGFLVRGSVIAGCAIASVVSVGCSSSHTGDADGGIVLPDTNMPPPPDSARLPDTGPPPIECGNGIIEAGESCDDNNTAPGDGCAADCSREAYCGDGTTDAGELCDDGNHISGDGCRSDCLSNEMCGNGVIDYAAGEVCDGGAMCGADCLTIMGCGDGTLVAPEECDDGPAPLTRWDGCGQDCRTERSMVLNNTRFAGRGMGCDYTGDGTADNRFADALGSGLALLNMLFMGGGGGPTLLLSYMGLDDVTGTNDPDLRVAWLTGADADMDDANNFGGMGEFLVQTQSLNADGSPTTSLQSSIVSRALNGGPEDLELGIGFLPLTLRDAYLRGTTMSGADGELYSLDMAQVCGVVPLQPLSFLNEDLIEGFGGGGGFMIDIPAPCDDTMRPSTMVDWLVGGATIAIIRITPTSPDIDLDGDGLESFEVDRDGATGCQPVIVACIDGDGTRYEGRDCYIDDHFADGYSAALQTDAIRAFIVGTTGG